MCRYVPVRGGMRDGHKYRTFTTRHTCTHITHHTLHMHITHAHHALHMHITQQYITHHTLHITHHTCTRTLTSEPHRPAQASHVDIRPAPATQADIITHAPLPPHKYLTLPRRCLSTCLPAYQVPGAEPACAPWQLPPAQPASPGTL